MKLRCENLVKKYGPRTVVKGVSMEVSQGEIVGFLGPNGAGKTTSFYMITGLIVPNDGKIFLDDEEITKLPMFKRSQKGVGYLAQEASVFRHMTVEDNIMSVMEMSKQFTKEERKQRLEDLLDEFNLHKVRKSKGIQLSGGERRRCEIARALAIDPRRSYYPLIFTLEVMQKLAFNPILLCFIVHHEGHSPLGIIALDLKGCGAQHACHTWFRSIFLCQFRPFCPEDVL